MSGSASPIPRPKVSQIIRRRCLYADTNYATCKELLMAIQAGTAEGSINEARKAERAALHLQSRRDAYFDVIHGEGVRATGGSAGEYTDMDWSELCPDNDGSTFPRPDFWP